MDPSSDNIKKEVSPVTSESVKPLIKKGMDKMLKRAEGIDENISGSFVVNGREMTILCPESIQKYSLSLRSKESDFLNSKAKFELGKVRRVVIRTLTGLETINAIMLMENGFELNLKKLAPGELYVLEVEYHLDDPTFIESLVNREKVNETPDSENTKYWMVAQMKHLESLKSAYGRIDLRDVDFSVDVGVHQDLNTKIPSGFKEQIETLTELTKKKGRDEKFKLYQKLLHIQTNKYGGKELDILHDIIEVFSPSRFSKFADVTGDFHYSNCEKGANVYDYPFVTWPKFMKVTSRTDLGLDKPASRGTLIYKRHDFLSELEKIFH